MWVRNSVQGQRLDCYCLWLHHGPNLLPYRLTVLWYRIFPETVVLRQLDDMLVAVRLNLWLRKCVLPASCGKDLGQWSNPTYLGRYIANGGLIALFSSVAGRKSDWFLMWKKPEDVFTYTFTGLWNITRQEFRCLWQLSMTTYYGVFERMPKVHHLLL